MVAVGAVVAGVIGSAGSSIALVVRGEIVALATKKIKMSAGTTLTQRACNQTFAGRRPLSFPGCIPLPRFPTDGIVHDPADTATLCREWISAAQLRLPYS